MNSFVDVAEWNKAVAAGKIVHKKFPDGKYYQINLDKPTIRLCSGMGGTCGIDLSDTWRDPLCPACRFQVNARAFCLRAEKVGLLPKGATR